MSNWETCPVCKGTGNKSTPYIGSYIQTCDVCNGAKIINSLTGLPPKQTVKDYYRQGLTAEQIEDKLDNQKGGEDEA